MKLNSKKIVLAYVPVLHEGYRKFFENHSNAQELFLIGSEIIKEFKPLVKDIRAVPTEVMKTVISSLDLFKEIGIADIETLKSFNVSDFGIIMPDEAVMHELHDKYFPDANAEYDNIFLRWDKHKSFEQKPVEADQVISVNDKDQDIIKILRKEAEKSADFWRQIGAAVVKNGKIIMQVHNKAVPDEQIHYTEGDPRSDFSKGVNVDLSLFIHCEAQLVAEAAQKGISLEGASMYVTTFPCPTCAKLVAHSGIKRLYYVDGYGVLDGERVLKSKGVEIIFVETK